MLLSEKLLSIAREVRFRSGERRFSHPLGRARGAWQALLAGRDRRELRAANACLREHRAAENRAAARRRPVNEVYSSGVLPFDLGGSAGTRAVADAVRSNL